MTQPTDRPGINDLTSDMLDQLYVERDHAVRVARSAAFDAAKALTAQLLAEQRAKLAEAALTAVRTLASQWAILRAYGSAASELRAVLDQHGQTPA